jgi:hypothetical protein
MSRKNRRGINLRQGFFERVARKALIFRRGRKARKGGRRFAGPPDVSASKKKVAKRSLALKEGSQLQLGDQFFMCLGHTRNNEIMVGGAHPTLFLFFAQAGSLCHRAEARQGNYSNQILHLVQDDKNSNFARGAGRLWYQSGLWSSGNRPSWPRSAGRGWRRGRGRASRGKPT